MNFSKNVKKQSETKKFKNIVILKDLQAAVVKRNKKEDIDFKTEWLWLQEL